MSEFFPSLIPFFFVVLPHFFLFSINFLHTPGEDGFLEFSFTVYHFINEREGWGREREREGQNMTETEREGNGRRKEGREGEGIEKRGTLDS